MVRHRSDHGQRYMPSHNGPKAASAAFSSASENPPSGPTITVIACGTGIRRATERRYRFLRRKEGKHRRAQGWPERHPGTGLIVARTARQLGQPDRFEPEQLERVRGRAFGPAWRPNFYASVIALPDLASVPCGRLWFPVPQWSLRARNCMERLQSCMVLSLCCFMCVKVRSKHF